MTRIACIGGFLGSGKTTAMIEAARALVARGLRVGIITNDQGHELVDTALVRSLGFQVEEIGGGCFCCRFSEFASNAERLAEQSHADIILAEAVGSCTDLSTTVCRRLRQSHSSQFAVAPLTVMVEPSRIRAMLRDRSPFNEEVRYLFGKQLAEADHVLLTKADLFGADEIDEVCEAVRQFIGKAPVRTISAKTGSGVSEWVDVLLGRIAGEAGLELDYDIYGAAEASLGWLNANVDVGAENDFLPGTSAETVLAAIQESCIQDQIAIAHVKVMMVTAEGSNWIALTASDESPAWGYTDQLSKCREASMIINARVCAPPQQLRQIIETALQRMSAQHRLTGAVRHLECFAPLPPQPPVIHSTVVED
jgi:Ni2+-binding GTPase involved in maturation of urease and hydrogenase